MKITAIITQLVVLISYSVVFTSKSKIADKATEVGIFTIVASNLVKGRHLRDETAVNRQIQPDLIPLINPQTKLIAQGIQEILFIWADKRHGEVFFSDSDLHGSIY